MERDGGFGIGTNGEDIIKENAEERYGPRHGDPKDRAEAMSDGLVDAKGHITKKGWARLNEDIPVLERNSMAWLRKTFNRARDEGHDGDELIGTFWYDTGKVNQAEMLVMGIKERIDMSDASYGDLAHTVWNGVSPFGQSVLGGAIAFYAVPDDAVEEAEVVADAAQRARRKPRAKRSRVRAQR